jgi:hypothetical protein
VDYLNIEKQKFRRAGERERTEKDVPDVCSAWAVLTYDPSLDPRCYMRHSPKWAPWRTPAKFDQNVSDLGQERAQREQDGVGGELKVSRERVKRQ